MEVLCVSTFGVNALANSYNAATGGMVTALESMGDLKGLSKPTVATVNSKVIHDWKNFTQAFNSFIDIMRNGGSENKYNVVDQKSFKSFDVESMVVTPAEAKKQFKEGYMGALKAIVNMTYTAPVVFVRNLPATDSAFVSFNKNHMTKKLLKEKYRRKGLK